MRLTPVHDLVRSLRLATVLAAVWTSACDAAVEDDTDTTPKPSALEVIGYFADNYGDHVRITATKWGAATIVRHDNGANEAITQNPPDDPWNPDKFNKVVWTEPAQGSFWVCFVDFGLATADEAAATAKTADAAQPAQGGCGGFPWTRYFEPLELEGRWATNYGMTDDVSSIGWNSQAIISFSNAGNWAVTQNPADDPWGPSKFSKVVWTELVDDSFYYCIVDYGRDTAEEAEGSSNTADATSPETGGCASFPWTRSVPAIELHGAWSGEYGDETIDSFTWATSFSATTVVSYDNDDNYAITQNPEDDQWNPSKFNRVVWTEPVDGSFWYCIVDFGLDSAEQALASTTTADASDPVQGGCGGFPWTALSAD